MKHVRYDREGRELRYISAWLPAELVKRLKRKLKINSNSELISLALEALEREHLRRGLDDDAAKLAKELLDE